MNTKPIHRIELKANAKASMRNAPGIYLVSLVVLVLTSAPTLVIRFSSVGRAILNARTVDEMLYAYQELMGLGATLFLASLLLNIFLSLVNAGYTLYTLRVSRGEDTGGISTLFACFQQFWRFVAATILMELFTFLWSLLLVIPGIIAAYSYSQTIFIMLDHPEMSAMEAIRESKQLMRGYKMDYFVLELSFIGWSLLVPLTMGILHIWLLPYMNVTYANFYNALVDWKPSSTPFEDQPQDDQWWNN